MISFDMTKEDVSELHSEQALKALEVMELLEKNSQIIPYQDNSLSLVFVPITKYAIQLTLFVLEIDDNQLVSDLSDKVSEPKTKVRKDLEAVFDPNVDVALINTGLLDAFLEHAKQNIELLIEKQSATKNESEGKIEPQNN